MLRVRRYVAQPVLVLSVFLIGTAYATTITNPGAISFTSNVDSRITFTSSGKEVTTNRTSSGLTGSEIIAGAVDSAGNMAFTRNGVFFEKSVDVNGWEATLVADAGGTGTFCPLTGQATISIPLSIVITKMNNNGITPCIIPLNDGDPVTFTTDASGSLQGVRFTDPTPVLVAQIKGNLSGGVTCQANNNTTVDGYYDQTNGTVDIELFGAQISRLLTGSGC